MAVPSFQTTGSTVQEGKSALSSAVYHHMLYMCVYIPILVERGVTIALEAIGQHSVGKKLL